MPQTLTTPDKLLNNPLGNKGFCDPGQYQCAIERCNSGYESLNLNIEIHEELVKIIKNFSDSLSKWSEQSRKRINSSKESSTTKQALRDCIIAAKKYTERNNAVADAIEKSVIKDLTTFKMKYGKCLIGVQKSKDFDTKFKRHQSTWLEALEKINESKQHYNEARRKLDKVKEKEEAAKTDVSSTDEQKRKASQEVERRQSKLKSYIRKYNSSIEGITVKQNEYKNDMFRVLKETDDFEKERLEQLQSSFNGLKNAFLIETEKYQESIKTDFDKAISLQKIDEDLDHFDKTFGSKTKTNWPTFEEIKE